MSIMGSRLLIPVFMASILNGQASEPEPPEVEFNHSVACIGETLYATCSSHLFAYNLVWLLDNSTVPLEFVASSVVESSISNPDENFTATLDSKLPNPSNRFQHLFTSTLTIAGSVNNTDFYCVVGSADGPLSSPVFTLTRFSIPSAPKNLKFNDTILSWDRPEYTEAGLNHYQVSFNGSIQNVTAESLPSKRANPIQGNTSVYTIDECGQSSEPSSLSSLVSAFLPLLSNPKALIYCNQPLQAGRLAAVHWQVDTTGVQLPASWQASDGLICDTDGNRCSGRLNAATEIVVKVSNNVTAATYHVDIVPNALFLESATTDSLTMRLNPDCTPMVYRVDIEPCGATAREDEDNLELRPGQTLELPVTASCIEASLLWEGNVIESVNITTLFEQSGTTAPALALPLLVMLSQVVLSNITP